MTLEEYKETIRELKKDINKNLLFKNIFFYSKDVALEKLKEKLQQKKWGGLRLRFHMQPLDCSL